MTKRTGTPELLILCIISSISVSVSKRSVTKRIRSASSRDMFTKLIMLLWSSYFGFNMPGVSEKTIWWSSPLINPMILWRVVWALEEIMESLSPISTFIKVDLPTLGLPTIFTNPALCVFSVMTYIFLQRYLNFPDLILPLYHNRWKGE